MMAKHYGYDVEGVKRLTFKQVALYMENLPYVLENSKVFGKAPVAEPPPHSLVEFASLCGVVVPYDVRYDLGVVIEI